MPSLFGLALLCFICGAMAALATRRRGSALAGMAAALAGGLAGPWASAGLGWPIAPLWAVLAGAVAASAMVAGVTVLLTHRR